MLVSYDGEEFSVVPGSLLAPDWWDRARQILTDHGEA